MKSQELVQIHALLFELRVVLEQDGTVPPGVFDAYETQSVRPTHIHRPKSAHEHAIGLLLDGLGQSVQTHPPPDHAPIS